MLISKYRESFPYKEDFFTCNEEVGFMKQSKLFQGDDKQCVMECANNEWCKSFDFCEKADASTSFCHLKDSNRETYDKHYRTGEAGTHYYSCVGDKTKSNIEVGKDKPTYFVGENKQRVLTGCELSKSNNQTVNCKGQIMFEEKSGKYTEVNDKTKIEELRKTYPDKNPFDNYISKLEVKTIEDCRLLCKRQPVCRFIDF